jgi:hypothetical protein
MRFLYKYKTFSLQNSSSRFHHQQLEDPAKTIRNKTTQPVPLFLFAQNRTPFIRPTVVRKILVKPTNQEVPSFGKNISKKLIRKI